ncbi:MAG TPA: hypothetical protein VIK30_05470 [Polyangia bacterium]
MAEKTASPVDRPGGGRQNRIGRIGRVLIALLVGALALSVTVPLVVRGPVARWALARATASRCGSFAIGGGQLGWAAIWELALGRPIAIALDDLRITGPDGQVVIAAAHLEATIEVHALPWRIVVADALVARGQWRLAIGPPGTIGTADAFRTVPDAGRPACLDPTAARVRRPAGAGGGSVSVRGLELEDVDVELDFPTWGLSLQRANASGTLSAGGAGPPILFDARDGVATAGTLRIGRIGAAWTTRVPFDAVAIERVAVAPNAPTDLQLLVAGARTGRARLSGHALFQNIFPTRIGVPPTKPPGLDVAARWTGFGAVLPELEADWRPPAAWAAHLDGDLAIDVKGPFTELAVTFQADGGGNHLSAHLTHGSADLTLALAGVDTRWMLDPALAPLLGGYLHGHFNATARLAPTLAGMKAEIADADLRLDRRRAPAGPRRFELRIGLPRRAPGTTDTLYAAIGRVSLADAILKLEDLRVDWTGLSARADALVAFPGTSSTTVDRPRSRVDAHGTVAIAALEDWIPGGAATGPLRLSATVRGTLERVDLRLRFPPPSTVGLFGQRFVLPARLDAAMVSDVGWNVPRFRLRRVGGGEAEIGGRLGAGGRLAATLRVHDYPVADLPGLDRAGLPGALGGTLGADLSLSGALERPTVEGRIGVTSLAFDGRRLGNAEAKLRLGSDRGTADVTIDPGVVLHAAIRRRPTLAVEAKLSLTERALGPWLPAPLTGVPVAASGDAKVSYAAGAALAADGSFRLTGPGLNRIELAARARGADAQAHLTGEIELGRWPLLWSRYLKSATGTATVDFTVASDLTVASVPKRPRVSGKVRIARDFVLRTPRWPAPFTLPAGGELDFDGGALVTTGLSIDTPGLHGKVAGRATLDPDDADKSTVALSLAAELDAARFPVRLPAGASATGRVVVDAKVTGTLGGSWGASASSGSASGPRIDGQARFEDLTIHPPAALPTVRARGIVEAHGDTLRTLGLHVDIAGVGTVTVGRPASPGQAELLSLSPLRFGRIDLPFFGENLAVGGPSSSLEIPDLDADVRLTGDAQGELKLRGEVAVSGGSYDPKRGGSKGPKTRASGPWYHALPPHLTLDLMLHGPRKAIQVAVPVLPDVTVDFQCHLVATNRRATLGGRLRGDGVYSRAAVAIYDWFTPGDLRRCQIGAP